MAVKSGKGCKLWSFEFLLVTRKCVTVCVRATSSPRGRSDRPFPPRTQLLHTAHLYIGKGFFISTCHNKADDVRYRSRIVMCCLVGGFFYGGNNNDKAFGSAKLMLAKLDRVSAPRAEEYDIQSR